MSPVDTAMLVQSLPFTFYSIPLRNHIHRDTIRMRGDAIYLQGWCFSYSQGLVAFHHLDHQLATSFQGTHGLRASAGMVNLPLPSVEGNLM